MRQGATGKSLKMNLTPYSGLGQHSHPRPAAKGARHLTFSSQGRNAACEECRSTTAREAALRRRMRTDASACDKEVMENEPDPYSRGRRTRADRSRERTVAQPLRKTACYVTWTQREVARVNAAQRHELARLSWRRCTRTQWACASARQDAERVATEQEPQGSRPGTAVAAGAPLAAPRAEGSESTEKRGAMQAA